MIKKIIVTLLCASWLMANPFNLDQNIGSFSLADQFEKKHTVDNTTKTMIVSFEKSTSADINDFLSKKEEGFLDKNNAVFIADISGMPSLITKFFALPKMKDYKYPVLLIYDEEDKRFLHKEEKLTVYKLENSVITGVEYIEKEDLESVF